MNRLIAGIPSNLSSFLAFASSVALIRPDGGICTANSPVRRASGNALAVD